MRNLVIAVFLMLLGATVTSSVHSYRMTESTIVEDLNQALVKTVLTRTEQYITPDTIVAYRSFLREQALRQYAGLCYALPGERRPAMCSSTMYLKSDEGKVCLRGYANCSAATIFALSDQRLSLVLSLLTFIWFFLGVRRMGLRRGALAAVNAGCAAEAPLHSPLAGRLSYDASTGSFFVDADHEIHFTPMQRQIMVMFATTADHTLTKNEICQALWPRKDDPNESLYTFIKRLKKTLADSHCQASVESDRGRAYRLR